MTDAAAHSGRTSPDELLIWDADGLPLGELLGEAARTVVLWRNYETESSPDAISIPRLIEAHADELRARYLAWIYEFGETRIRGKRLVDCLELRPGFSAWWMSLLAEKCNYSKSPQITDAIRLLALGLWAGDRHIDHVVLVSANRPLAETLHTWCDGRDIVFEWRTIPEALGRKSRLRQYYGSLPHSVQGLIWLFRYLANRWPLRGAGLQEWRETKGRVTFVSYLFNLVPDAAKDGRFENRYWANLPEVLQRNGCKTNWLHLYIKDALLPTAGVAGDAIRQFNKSSQGGQTHVTLDAFLGIGVVIRALRDWFWLARTGWRLQPRCCMPKVGGLDLWPLFREDWHRSFIGSVAISNVLFYNLFESALKVLPEQRVGVYLQENQGWEFALVHAWKAAGHGCLAGTPHSTVRYWDMRYYFDPRNYLHSGNNDLPLPDMVALNGAAALESYSQNGYPAHDLVEVEALRYLYLAKLNDAQWHALSPDASRCRVLVLGDYLTTNTALQMRLLERAIPLLPGNMAITVKPHPNCPVQPADYPGILMEVTMQPVSELLAGCDVAYTSSVTSAAVDAYCAGVPVVSVLDPATLNMSPLRGMAGVVHVTNPTELAAALNKARKQKYASAAPYFCLDTKLERWQKLLGIGVA